MNEELCNGTPANLACYPITLPVMTDRPMQHNPTQSSPVISVTPRMGIQPAAIVVSGAGGNAIRVTKHAERYC